MEELDPGPSFEGSSTELKRTVTVPTLDSEIPAGRNVIWCSSFELAWQEMKHWLGGPVHTEPAVAAVEKLNRAESAGSDLSSEFWYGAAGPGEETARRIAADMARRFPTADPPSIGGAASDALIVFAYLTANVRYTNDYIDNPQELHFTDTNGKRESVASFGLGDQQRDRYAKTAIQAKVLYDGRYLRKGPKDDEFAIDPCHDTLPHQVVFACVRKQATLEETVARVDEKESLYREAKGIEYLLPSGVLLVPKLDWNITHRFDELEGLRLRNSGFPNYRIGEAIQRIRFKLDHRGAAVESESRILLLGGAGDYVFDRPFLVFMRMRNARRPFFAMWIDNSELLIRA